MCAHLFSSWSFGCDQSTCATPLPFAYHLQEMFHKDRHSSCLAGFKRLRFSVKASRSAAGIPLAYINNFIQIWCGALFYGVPCGLNSCWIYLEPHKLPFESFSWKYIWIILLRSNTNDSRSGFHRADCNLQQCHSQYAAWSEFISTVCRMAVYSTLSWETAIVWNQPYRTYCISISLRYNVYCALVR